MKKKFVTRMEVMATTMTNTASPAGRGVRKNPTRMAEYSAQLKKISLWQESIRKGLARTGGQQYYQSPLGSVKFTNFSSNDFKFIFKIRPIKIRPIKISTTSCDTCQRGCCKENVSRNLKSKSKRRSIT